MRSPQTRLTIRRLMLVVAIAAAVAGWAVERHRRFADLARRHATALARGTDSGGVVLTFDTPTRRWRSGLQAKYERAARSPWLPVEPDPPEPE
jgi:hypothetical protein